MLDVIYAVRSDETTHRFVNHSLANLDSSEDVNPFALREPGMHVKGRKIEYERIHLLPCLFSLLIMHRFQRSEAENYVAESHEVLQKMSKETQ